MHPGEATRPFVDRPVGDVEAATAAAHRAAVAWRLGPPRLLRVGMNALFTADDVVLRVGAPSVPAVVGLELSEVLTTAGLAVPVPARDDVVATGDLQVTCWRRITPSDRPVAWYEVGEIVRRLHGLDPEVLPSTFPVPSPTSFPWWDFDALLARAGAGLDASARRGLQAAVDRHRGWNHLAGCVVCHGDVHPGNVMMTDHGPVLLDWDLLCWAPPAWDHAPLMTWAQRWGGRPGEYEEFARGYGRSFADDPAANAFAELRIVAATLMRVMAAVDEPAALPEAERRLRYWRGDPDAPPWTAQ
jgi:hypothetical protein